MEEMFDALGGDPSLAPEMRDIQNEPCCKSAPPTLKEETVVTGTDGALANVFVYVENAPAGGGHAEPEATIDQMHCRYVPRVVGVQVGQPLRITSSDATFHNVHYTPEKNPHVNLAFPDRDTVGKIVRFDQPEFVPLRCDVHRWMAAYVGVFANPFFATTDSAGRFEIKGLPPGTYTVVTWHERYPPTRRTVTVTTDRLDGVDFDLGKP
jgi:plastocyanin